MEGRREGKWGSGGGDANGVVRACMWWLCHLFVWKVLNIGVERLGVVRARGDVGVGDEVVRGGRGAGSKRG